MWLLFLFVCNALQTIDKKLAVLVQWTNINSSQRTVISSLPFSVIMIRFLAIEISEWFRYGKRKKFHLKQKIRLQLKFQDALQDCWLQIYRPQSKQHQRPDDCPSQNRNLLTESWPIKKAHALLNQLLRPLCLILPLKTTVQNSGGSTGIFSISCLLALHVAKSFSSFTTCMVWFVVEKGTWFETGNNNNNNNNWLTKGGSEQVHQNSLYFLVIYKFICISLWCGNQSCLLHHRLVWYMQS